MLTPSMGACLMPLTLSGAGMPVASRMVDDVDDVVELTPNAAQVGDVAWPGHDHALGVPTEMRRHLLDPLEGRVHRRGLARREMREGPLRSPDRVKKELVLDRHRDAVEGRELVRCAIEHAFGARAVVAADIDDQRIVEFAKVFDRLDDPADLMVGIGAIGAIDVGLPDEELFSSKRRNPIRASPSARASALRSPA